LLSTLAREEACTVKVRNFWNPRTTNSPYWNPYMETLPREKLDALHLKRLKSLLRYAYDNSPFYRRKFQEAEVTPEDIHTLEDFKRKVPITDKSDFLQLQEEKPHYGQTGAMPEEYLAHHCETSGTTGIPLRIPYTMYDTERYGESWAYGFWALGIRPTDSFYFAFNWGLFAGFWSAYWGVRRLGGKVYSGGGQTSEGHIRLIQHLKPSVLICTPTYALHLAEVAREMGVDPAGLSVKYTYHAGEPGPCALPAVRAQLEEFWGATSGELYGLAEVGGLAPGCPTREGVHMDEVNHFSWSRDPETGEEVPEGKIGENIVTTYVNNAQPLINYRTHDLVERHFSCECGRTWPLLRGVVLGRSDFMVTIRGTNVYQSAVENILGTIPGVSSHYQMILTREKGMDRMLVQVEPTRDFPLEGYAELTKRIEETIRQALKVRLETEVVPVDSLPRYELKTKRIIDQRPKEVRRALDR
jgi:phenylacetate-CoA ligase